MKEFCGAVVPQYPSGEEVAVLGLIEFLFLSLPLFGQLAWYYKYHMNQRYWKGHSTPAPLPPRRERCMGCQERNKGQHVLNGLSFGAQIAKSRSTANTLKCPLGRKSPRFSVADFLDES